MSNSLRPAPTGNRRGAAVVEFAICLPVICMFVLGVIETANAIFVQQALTSAAYEAANVASAMGNTSAQGQSCATQVLNAMGVSGGTVTITPAVTAATPTGTMIEVTCSAPLGANSAIFGYFTTTTLTAKVRMTRL